MTNKSHTKMSDVEYFNQLMEWPTKDNKSKSKSKIKENASRCITLKFNNAEWEEIERGAKCLWDAEVISKPTPYSFLKWLSLMGSASLGKVGKLEKAMRSEKKHSGGM